jgi:hypothetical protein
MLNYHHLALSGAAGRRFPDLALEGYAIPMVMVFRGRGRVEEIGRSFRRRAHKEGYRRGGVPIFMVSDTDWENDPLADGILHLAWDEAMEPLSLIDALLRSSARLLEARSLTSSQILELDLTPSPRRQAAKDAAERDARKKARERQARGDGGAAKNKSVKAPARRVPEPEQEVAELPSDAVSLTGDPLAASVALHELFGERATDDKDTEAPTSPERPIAQRGEEAEADDAGEAPSYEGRRRRAPSQRSI